jgi:predicted nucleic acid-binding protein
MSAEPGREFLDTNVLVYAHDRSAVEKHGRAVDLLERTTSQRRGALSVQVLQEFFVTVTGKLAKPLAAREAAAIVSDLGVLAVHAPDQADVLAAIDIHDQLQVSFWDAMVLRSASALGCAVLWSEDLGHGRRYDGVEVRSPFV